MLKFGDPVQIPGCSHKLRYLQTSSGNSGLDSLLGGALPNTCLCIVDEQQTRCYGDVLLRYFLSEGAHNGHDIVCAGEGADGILTSLPSKIQNGGEAMPQGIPPSVPGSAEDEMRIAWRYKTVQQKSSTVGEAKNRYDLGKSLDDPSSPSGSRCTTFNGRSYDELLKTLREKLAQPEYNKKEKGTAKRLLRIAIRRIGSPWWSDHATLARFLSELRLLCRDAYTVVMCSTDTSTCEGSLARRLETSADAFFRLVPVSDEEKKSISTLERAHGYFQLIRLPRVTSLAPFKPAAVDLIFELHRKSFDIKVLHLPPALGDDDSKETKKSIGGGSCSAGLAF